MPTIPQDYLVIISFLVTFISHTIRTDKFSNSVNALIAGASAVIIVLLTAWMTTGFSSDLRADVLLFCSIALSMTSVIKELLDLLGYQAQASSPLAPPAPFVPPAH